MTRMRLRTPGTSRRTTLAAALALALAVSVAALLAVVSPAQTQSVTRTFTVDRSDDRTVNATNAADRCTGANRDCTLRDAIFKSNNVTNRDVVINFAADVNEVTLSIPGPNEGAAQTGDLDISRSMTIDGGDGVIVGATEAFGDRIFEIFTAPGTDLGEDGTTATIVSLTIEDGKAVGIPGVGSIFGGGIFVDEWATLNLTDSTVQNNTATIAGGGIYLSNPVTKDIDQGGTANIENSVISENTSAVLDVGNGQPAGAGGGIAALGGSTLELTGSTVSDNVSNNLSGGIANAGDATIRRSTISGNTATAEAGGIGSGTTDSAPDPANELDIFDSTISDNTARSGAGLGIINTPALVANSTISGNTTTGQATGPSDFTGAGGGAGAQGPNASLFLESVTIAENAAPASGGGALASDTPDAISAVNVIVADNTQAAGGQCAGAPIDSIGFNLEFPTDSCGFENTGEDPLLGPLQNNGGPTETHALTKESPAVDQGNTELATDQRGEKRPSDFPDIDNAEDGIGADIGAFELQAPEPPDDGDDDGGGSNACTITGTNGDDVLRGTPGRDVICGFGGDDVIHGLGANDVLRGGPGDDALYGGKGDDELVGGKGRDVLRGEGGRDRLDARDGVSGNDVANGGPGRDTCLADPRDAKRSC